MTGDNDLRIPTVDLADLRSSDDTTRRAAAESIREGFATYGLVYVAGHDVDLALRDRLFERFVRFTDQPRDAKEKVNRPDIWYQRGWTPPNTEQAVVAQGQPDFKECYFAAPMPADPSARNEFPELFPDNVWPEDSADFAEDYLAVGRQLHATGLRLLEGLSLALGLPEHGFEPMLEGAAHVFRMLRYLPLNAEQVGTGILWGEEHTDFNLLTLLPGGSFLDPAGKPCRKPDDASGLFLRTRATAEHPQGRLVAGRAPAGCIVAQVGQELEILTGGEVQATPHVVTAPKSPGYTRVSGAHFVHLHPHQILRPLDKFRTPETQRAYSPPVLAGTYSIKTLADIGLAPKSAIDSLGYRHYGRLAKIRTEDLGGA